jgi:thiol-disulfide isomerase/thioredoxin/uncharacterized membrane protein YphA (DoxX/SURF4 family)
MEMLLLFVRLSLAGVFGLAGFTKLFDPAGSEKAFDDFGVPKTIAKPLIYLLPAVEFVIAVSLLFIESSWFGAIAAGALLTVFSIGMLYQMARGNSPECHCFGQIHSKPVGVGSVLRNLALMILAAYLVWQGRASQGTNIVTLNQSILQLAIGISVVALLGSAVFYLRRISKQQTQIMRRIELMELVGREGDTIERLEATNPHDGMPIGAMFPDFELADLDGAVVSLDDLKAERKPVVFAFVSPTCSPCQGLIPEFEQWRSELAEKARFLFVSSGSVAANIEKFGDSGVTLLLQKDRELADAVYAKWTPTMILMDAEGRVASHVGAGDNAIRGLIAHLKEQDLTKEFAHLANFNGHSHENKIGMDVPEFNLTDIRGREITSNHLKGRQTLVAFWSLTCGFCEKMIDDLRAWDKIRGKDEPDLIVFSDGDAAGNEKLDLNSPVIVDDGYKTAAGFGMFGTPSAVLVNEDGKIASETAVGAPFIWALIGKKG